VLEYTIDVTPDYFTQATSIAWGQAPSFGDQEWEKVMVISEADEIAELVFSSRHHFRNKGAHITSVGVSAGYEVSHLARGNEAGIFDDPPMIPDHASKVGSGF